MTQMQATQGLQWAPVLPDSRLWDTAIGLTHQMSPTCSKPHSE